MAYTKTLVCTVGLPRSGKSTWARKQNCPIVNPDSIRLAIHGNRFIGSAEPFVWATVQAMVKALFYAGHELVILDATSVTVDRRKAWISEEWETYWKVFDTTAEECERRAKLNSDDTIIPVIHKMNERYESLSESEQKNEITTIEEIMWKG